MSKKGRLNFLCQQCDTDISTVLLSSNFPVESLLYLHELCTVKKKSVSLDLSSTFLSRLVKYFFCQAMKGYFLNMAHISSMHEVGFMMKENLDYGYLTVSGKLCPDCFMMSP